MKQLTLTLLYALLLTPVAVAGLKPPIGWKARELPENVPVEFMATHENNGGIVVLKERKSDFEVNSVEEFLEIKVSNFEEAHETSELKQLSDIRIAGMPAKGSTFRVKMPDGKGVKIDSRYQIICTEKGNNFYTILLSCRQGSENRYATVFQRFLNSAKLE